MSDVYPDLLPCDLGVVHGDGPLSLGIRFVTRGFWETPTVGNHILGVSGSGPFRGVPMIEAMSKIRERGLWAEYHGTDRKVEIWRPLNITDEDREAIVLYARQFLGQRYPYKDLALHLLDIAAGTYFFRRFQSNKSRVCSRLWGEAFGTRGFHFGQEPDALTPDDMHDFIVASEGKYYEKILSLTKI